MSGGRRRLSDAEVRLFTSGKAKYPPHSAWMGAVCRDLLRCRKALRMLIRVYEQTGYQAGYVPHDIARAALNDAGGKKGTK